MAGSPERAVEVDDVADARSFLPLRDVADSATPPICPVLWFSGVPAANPQARQDRASFYNDRRRLVALQADAAVIDAECCIAGDDGVTQLDALHTHG